MFFVAEDYANVTRGRCARCWKIAFRGPPDYYCHKCRAWAQPGVGPTPLAEEIAAPYRLQDPGYVKGDEDDRRTPEEILLQALDVPWMNEMLEFVAQHRNHDCEHYDKCLNIAVFQQWYFFSCAACKLFGKKWP